MKYQIVVDSASDIISDEYNNAICKVKVAPLTIKIGNNEYIDDNNLNPNKMLEDMAASNEKQTTSCPNPNAFVELFEEAECTFCITISSKLSGTYNACLLAKEIVEKEGHKVICIDSKAVAGVERLMVNDILKYLEEGKDEATIEKLINEDKYELLFVLSSFDNLVKNGRMSKFTSIAASLLSIRPLFCANEGEIKLVKKIRTLKKSLDSLVDEMPNFKNVFNDVIITYCNNLDVAEKLKDEIINKYNQVNVTLVPTRGLTSFYANVNGIIVSFR